MAGPGTHVGKGRRWGSFPEVRNFAKSFVVLQVERQKADYALDMEAYRTSDVLEYIVSAERAIDRFERADAAARRAFAAHVLFRQRSSQEIPR